jgi:pyruvate formate lyase activating enzyme
MDGEAHKRGTGVDNKRILENAHRLAGQGVDLIVRVPVVPGINDSPTNMAATAEFLGDFPRLLYVELLPYHDLGVDKFTSLGISSETAVFNIPTEDMMRSLARNFEVHRIPVRIN